MNTDAYKTAREFLHQNTSVVGTIGEIQSSRLGIFNFSVHERMTSGEAFFDIVAKGHKSKATVTFILNRSDKVWHVEKATMKLTDGLVTELK